MTKWGKLNFWDFGNLRHHKKLNPLNTRRSYCFGLQERLDRNFSAPGSKSKLESFDFSPVSIFLDTKCIFIPLSQLKTFYGLFETKKFHFEIHFRGI